jgi:hypothetical protein
MIARLRKSIARRRLARMVEANRRSPACVEYRRRRDAAKLGIARKEMAG